MQDDRTGKEDLITPQPVSHCAVRAGGSATGTSEFTQRTPALFERSELLLDFILAGGACTHRADMRSIAVRAGLAFFYGGTRWFLGSLVAGRGGLKWNGTNSLIFAV